MSDHDEATTVRAVAEAHGQVQPDPESYTTAELVEWLKATAVTDGDRAALALLTLHGRWLDRADWRTWCITVIDQPDGRRVAFIEYAAWRKGLADYVRYQSGSGEGMPFGLHHSESGAVMAEMVMWVRDNPINLRKLDLPNTRNVVEAVAILCGYPMREVVGGVWPLEPVPWIGDLAGLGDVAD